MKRVNTVIQNRQDRNPDARYGVVSFRVNTVEEEAIRGAVPAGKNMNQWLRELVFSAMGR